MAYDNDSNDKDPIGTKQKNRKKPEKQCPESPVENVDRKLDGSG